MDQLIPCNHNKNLTKEEWAIIAENMGEKYPIHFRAARNTAFFSKKDTKQAQYKTQDRADHKRVSSSNLYSDEPRKKLKTKSDSYGCIEWSTVVMPPNESFQLFDWQTN
jgi:hypothetical protein